MGAAGDDAGAFEHRRQRDLKLRCHVAAGREARYGRLRDVDIEGREGAGWPVQARPQGPGSRLSASAPGEASGGGSESASPTSQNSKRWHSPLRIE
jgi:hypothetical protein